jgi:hypothetical protein
MVNERGKLRQEWWQKYLSYRMSYRCLLAGGTISLSWIIICIYCVFRFPDGPSLRLPWLGVIGAALLAIGGLCHSAAMKKIDADIQKLKNNLVKDVKGHSG